VWELYKKLNMQWLRSARGIGRVSWRYLAEKVAEVVETPAASAIVFAYGHEVGEVTKALTKVQYLSKVIFILYTYPINISKIFKLETSKYP
jgi:hypothetical protein